ncbi:MAG: hypothetical protein ABI564_13390, partial [Ideonella sp.]
MDILAHGLWAGIGIAALARRMPVTRRTAAITVGLAVLPDVLQMLPLIVFTHSAQYDESPVFYPFTYRGFDGIAWNTPWFVAANYLALAAAGLWVWIRFT